jgi:hypothetical protein
MIDILRLCGVTIGSLRKIFIILPEDVSKFGAAPYIVPVTTEAMLYNGTREYSVKADRNTAIFTEKKVTNNKAGDYYEQNIQFQIRQLRVDVDYVSQFLINRRVHLLTVDNNGRVMFHKMMRQTDAATTGDQWTAKNGYTFTFTSRTPRKQPSIPTAKTRFTLLNGTPSTGTTDNPALQKTAQFVLYEANTFQKTYLNVWNDGRMTVETL